MDNKAQDMTDLMLKMEAYQDSHNVDNSSSKYKLNLVMFESACVYVVIILRILRLP